MNRREVGIAIVAVALSGCGARRQAKPGPGVLMTADREFARATAERRLEGFSSFLAEDVTTIRPNSPVVHGKKEVADRWAKLLSDPASSITWNPLHAAISDDGEMGFTLGSYEVTRANGLTRAVAGTGKYVTIWRKQSDGSWKVAFDSGVQDTPQK
jgi:ketosteroid isomerase-like protein